MRLMSGCLLALVCATTQAAERNLRAWEMKSLGRTCEISAFARSAVDDNYMLFVNWSADQGYEFHAWGQKIDDAMVIESVGTGLSFTVSPVNLGHLLKGTDAEALSSHLAGGVPLRLTVRMLNQPPQVFMTPTANAAEAAAGFGACVRTLENAPVPGSERTERGYYVAVGTSEGCDLERLWRTSEGAFTLTLRASARGGAVEFARVIGSHSEYPTTPFTVDARNFHGVTSSDMRSVRIGLGDAQLAQLETELQAGKPRTFDLTIPGATTETLTFGEPLTRAPAAMFASCRRTLAPAPVATN